MPFYLSRKDDAFLIIFSFIYRTEWQKLRQNISSKTLLAFDTSKNNSKAFWKMFFVKFFRILRCNSVEFRNCVLFDPLIDAMIQSWTDASRKIVISKHDLVNSSVHQMNQWPTYVSDKRTFRLLWVEAFWSLRLL